MDQKSSERVLTVSATRRIPLQHKSCPQCGKSFMGPAVKKYCTSTCAKKAAYWRNPEAYRASRRKSYRTKRASGHPPQSLSTSTSRSRELAWRQTHGEEFRQLAGQWVVLDGETIVSHGPDAVQVVEEARTQGITVPYIFFVDDTPNDSIHMGL